MKHLAILGSTGSIGRNTLKIVERFPDRFSVVTLSARSNVERLARQIEKFHPKIAVVGDEDHARRLEALLPPESGVAVLYGAEGYQFAACHDAVDMVVTAVVGAAGLRPTLAAIEAGKDIALANKETLVMAGEIVMRKAVQKGVRILPVDSEHSAIFQCLQGNRFDDLETILLTGSGGPFRERPLETFSRITLEDALKHPNWQMGKKITIDSATLMNKGLEVIEAKWLFDVALDRIEVVIHPQSLVHSMVAFHDGSVMAQIGIPDMMGAIAYAIAYPERLPLKQPIPDFAATGTFDFQEPDLDKFPCLALAFKAGKTGGTMPAVLNAANEVAVAAFLDGDIEYVQIAEIISAIVDNHKAVPTPALSDIIFADEQAREEAAVEVGTLGKKGN
jgi:1-deoxy-D-xylulose-5-phosphate reductoisomerase